MKKNKTPEERLEMDILKDELEAFEAQDFDGISARAEIIPLITEDDESFLLHEDALPDDMPLLPLHGNVLFPGVVIEEGAVVKNSVICSEVTIAKDTVIENQVVDKYASILHAKEIIADPENPGYVKRLDTL